MLLLLSSWLIHVPITMRLCNSRLPEEHFGYYQTSQGNWVIIKELYRCLQRYMLGWRISRLGFVTPIVGEVSLGPLGNAHHLSLASIATNELVAGWCITEWVKRLAGNEIELGTKIPTVESRASNIPIDKGNYVYFHKVWPIKIFVEYVRTNMGIQVPLLVIDRE